MGRPSLNLRHLRAFCEVARSGGVSAAAERVHLSQPAITQGLAKLEQQLDIALFTRSNTGMRLTEPGARFMRRAEGALRHISDGARVAAAKGGPRGGETFEHHITSAQLRALAAVSKSGNFSLAAHAIGVSQPSLHRAARDLERLANVKLFEKVPRGIELTPAAEALARHAGRAFAELDQGFEEIDAWRGVDSSRLVVGTLPLAQTFILPYAISRFTDRHPGARLDVTVGPYDDLLHGLRYAEIDLMIGALRDPPPADDVKQRELFQDALAIFARPDHPLFRKGPLTIEDLADRPWVAPRQGTPTRAHFDALFRDAGIAPPERLVSSNSLILVRGLLAQSDRLTVISAHQIQHEEQRGEVRRLPFSLDDTARPIGTTTRADWRPTATQAHFLELLGEACIEAPDLDG